MDPGPRGKPGQALCFWHDAAERKVESADLLSWMRRVVRDLPKAEIEPMPQPVVVSGQGFRNAVDAQKRAVRGDTDLAMEALRGFREQGDASAAAALSLLHAFRGEWSAVIELSSFVLAHSDAFHHVHVPREHCELLARAAAFTGRWSDVAHAANLLAPSHAGKASTKRAESAGAGKDLLNVADHDESSPEENDEKYQRHLEQGVPSTYSATEQSRRRHHFLMAVRYRRIDVALRFIAEAEEVVELRDAVALAPFVPEEELWPITLASLQRWYPVYTAQVAPAELITTPFMRDIMTPQRCDLVLSTPRARHHWDFRRAAS